MCFWNVFGWVLTRPNCVRPLCSAELPGTSAFEQSALQRTNNNITIQETSGSRGFLILVVEEFRRIVS